MSAATAHAMSAEGRQGAEASPPSLSASPTRPNLLQSYRWRFWAVRGSSRVQLHGIESVTWDDANAILTGTVTLRDMPYGIATQLQVDEGDQIACEVDSGGGFSELWKMRISSPDVTVKERQRTYQLANDLDLLNRSDSDWYFKAGKHTDHPAGWLTHDVIAAVCRDYGVSIGLIAEGTYRRRKSWSWRSYSPLRVIEEALNVERQHTGRRFVVRYDKGRLWVTPLRRNPDLLELGTSLIEAELQSHLPRGETASGVNEGYFASSVTLRGLRNEPKKKDKQGRVSQAVRKMQVVRTSAASVLRFGFVHRIVWSGDAKTEADLEEEALQYLAAVAKPIKQVTLTHTGIPTIRRGDAIKLAIGDASLQNQIVWVTEASFTLSPSDFTMALTVTFDDPYLNKISDLIQSRVSDTQLGAEKIAKHLKPKKAKTRAPGDPLTSGDALPSDTQARIDRNTAGG